MCGAWEQDRLYKCKCEAAPPRSQSRGVFIASNPQPAIPGPRSPIPGPQPLTTPPPNPDPRTPNPPSSDTENTPRRPLRSRPSERPAAGRACRACRTPGQSNGCLWPWSISPAMQSGDSSAVMPATGKRRSASNCENDSRSVKPLAGISPIPSPFSRRYLKDLVDSLHRRAVALGANDSGVSVFDLGPAFLQLSDAH